MQIGQGMWPMDDLRVRMIGILDITPTDIGGALFGEGRIRRRLA